MNMFAPVLVGGAVPFQQFQHELSELKAQIARIAQQVTAVSNAAHTRIRCSDCAELKQRIEALEAWRAAHSPCDRSSIGSEGLSRGSSEWSPVKGRTIFDLTVQLNPEQSPAGAPEEVERLKKKVENLNFEIAKLSTEIGKEKNCRKDLQGKMEQLTARIECFPKIVESSHLQTEEERQIPHLQSQVAKMETALLNLSEQMEKNQQIAAMRLSELQSKLTSLDNAQKGAKKTVKKIEEVLKGLEETLTLLAEPISSQPPARSSKLKKGAAIQPSHPKVQPSIANELVTALWQYVLFLHSNNSKPESKYAQYHLWIYEVGKSQSPTEESEKTVMESMKTILEDKPPRDQNSFFTAVWDILGYLSENGQYLVFQYFDGNCRKFWPILDRLNGVQKQNVLLAWKRKEGMQVVFDAVH